MNKLSFEIGGLLYHYLSNSELDDLYINNGLLPNPVSGGLLHPFSWFTSGEKLTPPDVSMFGYYDESEGLSETELLEDISEARVVLKHDASLLSWLEYLTISGVGLNELLEYFPSLLNGEVWYCSIGIVPASSWVRVEVFKDGQWMQYR